MSLVIHDADGAIVHTVENPKDPDRHAPPEGGGCIQVEGSVNPTGKKVDTATGKLVDDPNYSAPPTFEERVESVLRDHGLI